MQTSLNDTNRTETMRTEPRPADHGPASNGPRPESRLGRGLLVFAALGLAGLTPRAAAQAGSSEAWGWNGKDPAALVRLRESFEREGGFAEALANELEALRVDIRIGKASTLRARLGLAWTLATAVDGFEGQADVLARCALARHELELALGDAEAANAALQGVFFPSATAPPGVNPAPVLVEVSPALLREVQSSPALQRLAQARQASADLPQESPEPSMRDAVRQALAVGDFALLVEIGPRVWPDLAEEIQKKLVESPNDFPRSVTSDPLTYLVRVSEGRAARFLVENLNKGGFLWKKRLLRAMRENRVLSNEGTWSRSAAFDAPVCLEPEWLEVLEILANAPDTARESLSLVREAFLRDNLTPGLQRALIAGVKSDDIDLVNDILALLDVPGVGQTERSVLEAMVEHPLEHVRLFASERLTSYPESAACATLARSADARLRRAAALLLGRHSTRERPSGNFEREGAGASQSNTSPRRSEINPVLGAAQRPLLAELIRDPDAETRRLAVKALAGLEVPFEDEVVLGLTADPDAEVRVMLLAWSDFRGFGPELAGRILARLVADPDARVREAARSHVWSGSLPITLRIPALRAVLEDKRRDVDWNSLEMFIQTALTDSRTFPPLIELALDLKDDNLLEKVVRRASDENIGTISDETLALLYARVFANGKSVSLRTIERVVENANTPRRSALRLLVEDHDRSPVLRLRCAYRAAPDGGEAFREHALALLADPYWTANRPSEDHIDWADDLAEELPAGERNAFILDVVKNAAIGSDFAGIIAANFDRRGPGAVEIADAILERWLGTNRASRAVDGALLLQGTRGKEARTDDLLAALLDSDHTSAALVAVAALRDPVYLEALERCLQAEWIQSSNTRLEVRLKAAEVITGYLSDEAAAVLLRGMGTSGKEVRYACRLGLTTIEEYRDAVRAWEGRLEDRPTKESALAELVEMLESDSELIRSQAVYGLGTLGAIEFMPRLIRMLEDPSPEVARAANAALDLLNKRAATSDK